MNPLLCTDVYKMGHMEQYPKGTEKIYSYLTTRTDKKFNRIIFYGLQYYLLKYLMHQVTKENVEEFLETRKSLLGMDLAPDLVKKLYGLVELGYLPLHIKALPEGSRVLKFNALMTVTNTHPDYAFLVGFLESLLLKVWYSSNVATVSAQYKEIAARWSEVSCDNGEHLPFAVHDFGYRGSSSEETAAIGGSAHLLNFLGTDTVPAIGFAKQYYGATQPIGLSVPATEHCVMCVYGKDGEFEAFERIIDTYPKDAIISIVSDTYNLWRVLDVYLPRLRDKILARTGKVVIRPDSGDPVKIICGNDDSGAPTERGGVLRKLGALFGTTTNKRGYKVLHPQIGVIYGDGMYLERYETMLQTMTDMQYASSNLVVGVGGLLLQQHSRDDAGFAFKATHCVVDNELKEVYKDPITDSSKKSHKGLMRVEVRNGEFVTYDQQTQRAEESGELKTVFFNGHVIRETFQQIRQRVSREAL